MGTGLKCFAAGQRARLPQHFPITLHYINTLHSISSMPLQGFVCVLAAVGVRTALHLARQFHHLYVAATWPWKLETSIFRFTSCFKSALHICTRHQIPLWNQLGFYNEPQEPLCSSRMKPGWPMLIVKVEARAMQPERVTGGQRPLFSLLSPGIAFLCDFW